MEKHLSILGTAKLWDLINYRVLNPLIRNINKQLDQIRKDINGIKKTINNILKRLKKVEEGLNGIELPDMSKYYTKDESDERFAPIDHTHDDLEVDLSDYYTKDESDERFAPIKHRHDIDDFDLDVGSLGRDDIFNAVDRAGLNPDPTIAWPA